MSDNLKLSETPAAFDGRDSLGEDGAHDGITRSSILVGMMRAIVTGATSGIGSAGSDRWSFPFWRSLQFDKMGRA
jgi:hypothetical protein